MCVLIETVIFMNMCMLYDDFGSILVQNRVKGSWTGYTFPGGHVEKDETFNESVIREVFEETGLTIQNPILCGIKHWYNNDSRSVVLCYKTNKFSGEINSSSEGEISWIKKDDFLNLNFASGMNYMIDLFLKDDVSEHYFTSEDGKLKNNII